MAEGKAPVFAEILRRGTYLPGLRERVPLGDPGRVGIDHDGHDGRTATACPRSTGTTAASGAMSTTARPAQAVRTFGLLRAITDTVYNMNFDHLQPRQLDVLRAARRRGRADGLHAVPDLPRPHASRARRPGMAAPASRRRRTSGMRSTGPSELFYGELYSSQRGRLPPDACATRHARSLLGMRRLLPRGHDLYDFMLFSLPDNDHYSHRLGPQATVDVDRPRRPPPRGARPGRPAGSSGSSTTTR